MEESAQRNDGARVAQVRPDIRRRGKRNRFVRLGGLTLGGDVNFVYRRAFSLREATTAAEGDKAACVHPIGQPEPANHVPADPLCTNGMCHGGPHRRLKPARRSTLAWPSRQRLADLRHVNVHFFRTNVGMAAVRSQNFRLVTNPAYRTSLGNTLVL